VVVAVAEVQAQAEVMAGAVAQREHYAVKQTRPHHLPGLFGHRLCHFLMVLTQVELNALIELSLTLYEPV
jgi:hypothetical protein